MAKGLGNIPLIENFIFESDSGNVNKKWTEWKEDFDLYLSASGVTQEQQKRGLLLHLGGKELKKVYKTLKETDDKYENIVEKLNNHFGTKKNIMYERFIFKQAKQNSEEDTATYITRLRTLAETCDFANTGEEIRDHFVSSCYSRTLKEKLLRETDLTLQKCLEIGKSKELSRKQAEEMTEKNRAATTVNRVDNKNKPSHREHHRQNHEESHRPKHKEYHHHFNRPKYRQNRTSNNQQNTKKCYRCGDDYDRDHNRVCKANGKICHICQKKNHLSSCCKSKKTETVDKVEYNSNSESEGYESFAVSSKEKTKSTKLAVNNVEITMIIDSGSSINIIDKNTFEEIKKENKNLVLLQNIKTKIFPYASKPVKTLGYFRATLETKNKITTEKVFVVDHYDAGNLLCFHSAKELDLIQIKEQSENVNSINKQQPVANQQTAERKIRNSILQDFPEVFKGRGKLKNFECKFYINKDIQPVAQKLRRQPYHIRKAIKNEIERLEAEDVIERVEGPQEWVSNVVVIPKSNGKVRLCLDARMINTAIKRETYPIPTLESIVDQMHGAKIFAKLDLKEAYTQLELHENSRNITCFNTEGGIYRHKRLVYGINNSFEIFQRAMEQSIGTMEGVKFIADDIIVYAINDEELLQKLKKIV